MRSGRRPDGSLPAPSPAAAGIGPGGLGRRRLPLAWLRADHFALAVLVLLPVVVFVLPAAFGHLLVPGDDLTQNLPLRILVGSDLRSGHLPLWDPFIWSGTPLLAGFNAGALYPLTLLFGFLPAWVAWPLGQALTYAACASGVFLLARRQGLGVPASWAGAFVFTWSGFMAAQLAHVGLVEGLSLAAWVLLGIDHLSDHQGGSILVWTGATGATAGLVCLAGDPRAISDVAVAALVYAVWAAWRRPAGRPRLLLGLLGAAAVAAALAMGQLLPGLAAEAASQRAGVSIQAFGAGSLLGSWILLLAYPFVLGGFDTLHLPTYWGTYNLPEMSGYVGLLSLAGALAALAAALERPLRRLPAAGPLEGDPCQGAHPGGPSAGAVAAVPGATPGLWGVLALVGILLAMGNQTPLGDLLVRVPLYGGQRLQSRNLGEVDLALAMLFAGWAELFVHGGWTSWRSAWPRRAALLAPVSVAAVMAFGAAWPGGMVHFLGARDSAVHLFPSDWPYALVTGVLAVLVVWAVLRGDRLGPPARLRLVVVVTVLDVGFFFANAAYGWVGSGYIAQARQVPAARLATYVAPGARYALVDPNLYYPGYTRGGKNLLPVPDLNVLSGLPSVQGYGSLVADSYESATGTHTQGGMDPSVLSSGLADQLDLGTVFVNPDNAEPAILDALFRAGWVWRGVVDGLEVWQNPHRLVTAWLSGAAGTVNCGPPAAQTGAARCVARSRGPARLVRSEAWAPGWTATVRRVPGAGVAGGPSASEARAVRGPGSRVAVVSQGLVQSVPLPGPGTYVVTFGYRPGHAYAGLALSGLGALAAGGLVVAGGVLSRRSRRLPARPPK